MKKYISKVILGFIVLAVGWFGVNYVLEHKEIAFPIDVETTKFIVIHPENRETMQGQAYKNIPDEKVESVIDDLNQLELEPDKELQAQIEKTGYFWTEEEPVIELEVHLHFDFWQRTQYIWMMLYEDGHVALRYDGAYPQYYTTPNADYMKIIDRICDMRELAYTVYPAQTFEAANEEWVSTVTIQDNVEEEKYLVQFHVTYLGETIPYGAERSFYYLFADEKTTSISFSSIWEDDERSWEYQAYYDRVVTIDHIYPEEFIAQLVDAEEGRRVKLPFTAK